MLGKQIELFFKKKKDFIYLFLRDTERGVETQAEGEAGEPDVGLNPRTPGGSVVEHLPWAQGVILGSWDRVPHRAPCREPASPSAWVSASLCVSQE